MALSRESGTGGRLSALERESRALEELGGLRLVACFLVEVSGGLVVARALVGRRSLVLVARAGVHSPGGGVRVAGLESLGGLGQHADGLEQLRGSKVVAPLHEPRGGLGHIVLLEGHLATEGRGLHRIAGLLEGGSGARRHLLPA